jgi:hypothetical protein
MDVLASSYTSATPDTPPSRRRSVQRFEIRDQVGALGIVLQAGDGQRGEFAEELVTGQLKAQPIEVTARSIRPAGTRRFRSGLDLDRQGINEGHE